MLGSIQIMSSRLGSAFEFLGCVVERLTDSRLRDVLLSFVPNGHLPLSPAGCTFEFVFCVCSIQHVDLTFWVTVVVLPALACVLFLFLWVTLVRSIS